tara:strand:- start:129 stop:2264 length:2136 start_codon:yes stop_codon:yes gene_type:complete
MAGRNELQILLKLRDQTAAGVKSATSNIARLSAGVTAAAAPMAILSAAVGGAVLQFAKMGDEVEKMSRRTGFSVESLSELQFAAQQTGTSIQGLELGIRRMQKNLLDAERGLSTSVDGFDRLNLSVQDLITLSPEEQFDKILLALADLPSEYEKVALAQDLFGRAGTQLIPMMDAGAEGIARLRQEARDLGIVFDAETAAKAARMTDAMNSAKQSVNALAIDIGSTVEPAVTALALGFSKLPGPLRAAAAATAIFFVAMRAGIISLRTALISTGIGAFIVSLTLLAQKLGVFDTSMGETTKAIESGRAELENWATNTLPHSRDQIIKTMEAGEGLAFVFSETGDEIHLTTDETRAFLASLESGLAPQRAFALSLGDDAKAATILARNLGVVADETHDLAVATEVAEVAIVNEANAMISLTSTALAAKLALKLFALEQAGLPAGAAIFTESIMAEVRALQQLQSQEERIALITQSLIGPTTVLESAVGGLGGAYGRLNDELGEIEEKAEEIVRIPVDVSALIVAHAEGQAAKVTIGNLIAELGELTAQMEGPNARAWDRWIEILQINKAGVEDYTAVLRALQTMYPELGAEMDKHIDRLKDIGINTAENRAILRAAHDESNRMMKERATANTIRALNDFNMGIEVPNPFADALRRLDPNSTNRRQEFADLAAIFGLQTGGGGPAANPSNHYGDTIINVETPTDASEALEVLA